MGEQIKGKSLSTTVLQAPLASALSVTRTIEKLIFFPNSILVPVLLRLQFHTCSMHVAFISVVGAGTEWVEMMVPESFRRDFIN